MTLEIRFSGVDDNAEHSLGLSVYHAVFTRGDSTQPFKLKAVSADVPSKSKITTSEFEILADLDSDPSTEDLIRLDLHGLTAVAIGKDSAAKDYLKELLNRSKDTPEVRQLKSLLR